MGSHTFHIVSFVLHLLLLADDIHVKASITTIYEKGRSHSSWTKRPTMLFFRMRRERGWSVFMEVWLLLYERERHPSAIPENKRL
jgi:hypothetical protein